MPDDEYLTLETEGYSVKVRYAAIDGLITALEQEELDYRSRDLRAQVEALIEGTPLTLVYALAWKGFEMVGIGLHDPRYPNTPIRCQNYPDKALAWVRYWIDASATKEVPNAV